MGEDTHPLPTLVVGGTGKTGRRIVDRLTGRGLPVRIGSRSDAIAFDWEEPATWKPVLQNVRAAYISYYPDLAAPGASDAIASFADLAVASGTRRLVLLSGRGEEEAQASEKVLADSGADWTIVRSSWFNQTSARTFCWIRSSGARSRSPAATSVSRSPTPTTSRRSPRPCSRRTATQARSTS